MNMCFGWVVSTLQKVAWSLFICLPFDPTDLTEQHTHGIRKKKKNQLSQHKLFWLTF